MGSPSDVIIASRKEKLENWTGLYITILTDKPPQPLLTFIHREYEVDSQEPLVMLDFIVNYEKNLEKI